MLGPKPDTPEHETWEPVADHKTLDCDTIMPMHTAYGVRIGEEVLWLRTVTDLTPPDVRERYRRRCHLMATAPELLEAAKAALAAIEMRCNRCEQWCDGECFDASCSVHTTVARIEAAVAKAEGRDAGERDTD